MTARDAKTLYREAILEHGKSSRNEGALPDATHEATKTNPLCGDRVTVRLHVEGELIRGARFEARGCMIARASASILTEAISGSSTQEARELIAKLDGLLQDELPPPDVGALEPLRAAREFPARRACVALAWRALEASLVSPK